MRQYTFPMLINHPDHAPVLPRSCGSQEELDLLRQHGWYVEGEAPSPIAPGDVPDHNADQATRMADTPVTDVADVFEDPDTDNPDDVDETVDAMVSEGKQRKPKAKKS